MLWHYAIIFYTFMDAIEKTWESLGLVWFYVFEKKSLHLVDQKYSKIVKYYYNLK